ncbi:MAG: hypothetical protein A2Z83_00405 [Omnitrophica bacterium GWA2_52_8]|nr:MAG: hypothetical protein A2Z83_00405 [Omnitrophica bacterium GWA2_52_8]
MMPTFKHPAEDKLKEELSRKSRIPRKSWNAENCPPLGDEGAWTLFKAYFNNKMTGILFLLQSPRPASDSTGNLKAILFIQDIYHHMLCGEAQRRYVRLFQWLHLFFLRYPEIKPMQRRKAVEYIGILYKLFGMELKINI